MYKDYIVTIKSNDGDVAIFWFKSLSEISILSQLSLTYTRTKNIREVQIKEFYPLQGTGFTYIGGYNIE